MATTKPVEASTPTPEVATTKPYPVVGSLTHDGKEYVAGDTVQLTDNQASVLGDWVIGEAL